MRRTAFVITLAVLALAPFLAADESLPELTIVSRVGVDQDVKLYNDEPILFFAKVGDGENAPLLRGVEFVLYDEGGTSARRECIRAESTDPLRWGCPPSSFEFPLLDRKLPVGRYRLRATKRGLRSAEIKLVTAEFRFHRLRADHERDFYRASFHLRLVDRTEKRLTVPASVRVETANGGLLDSIDVKLVRNLSRTWLWETATPVRISSRVKNPDMSRPRTGRTGVLKLVPNCRVILVLGEFRFPWPVPLPSPSKEQSGSD